MEQIVNSRRLIWIFVGFLSIAITASISFAIWSFCSDTDPPEDRVFEYSLNSTLAMGNPFDEFRRWPGQQSIRRASFESEFWLQLDELLKVPPERWRTGPVLVVGNNGWRGFPDYESLDLQLSDIGRLGSKKVHALILQNNTDEATALSLKLIRLGAGMFQIHADAFVLAAATTILSDGFRSLADSLAAGGKLAETERRMISEIKFPFTSFDWALRIEYARFKSKLELTRRLGKGFPIEWNFEPWELNASEVRINPNTILGEIVNNWSACLEPHGDWSYLAKKVLIPKPEVSAVLFTTKTNRNGWIDKKCGRFATWVISYEFTTTMKYLAVDCLKAMLWQRMTVCELAIRSFESDTGSMPSTLDDLVPKHLERLPEDPFSGRPLSWNKSLRYLWSCGWDGVDDGGRVERGEWLWPGPIERSATSDADTDLGMKYWWDSSLKK